MNDKHTPGPWHVEQSNSIYAGNRYIGFALDGKPYGKELPQEANARLMAAAPEMLLILKAFVVNGLDAPEFLFARDMAEKTIAKIEGND